MKQKIRAALGLLVLSSAMVSCTTTKDADVYTIEFYTDYEGIEYASGKLDKTKATKIGEGYVVKGRGNQVARLTSLIKGEDGKAIDYENSRQTKEGHTFTWDSWVGFYGEIEPDFIALSNGTAVGENISGTKVDLKEIKGDCAVFAHFSDSLNTYNVTIENADSNPIYSESLEYGTKLSDALIEKYGSEDEARKALTLDYPLPKYYYQTYTFAGYKNGDDAYNVDKLLDGSIEIKDDLKLTASFAGPESKTYTVTFYKDSTKAKKLGDAESVIYGNAVTKTLDGYTSDHKVYTFKGWEGTYGEDAPEGVAGKPVDKEHILYDCALCPVFEEAPEKVTITFLNNDDSPINTQEVSYGSSFKDILPTEIDDKFLFGDEAFTGLWSEEKDAGDKTKAVDPSKLVEEALTLYPIVVKKSVDATGEEGDSFTYEYSLDWGGYLLTKFTPSSTRSGTELSAKDLSLSPPPGNFELTGIKKFSDESDDYSSTLTKAVFPESVKYVASNAFRGNKALETLELPGLQKVDSFAFSQLFALSSFTLPSSLTSIGSRAFYGCTKLGQTGNKITVKMSENAFSTNVEHSSEWKKIGEGDANVEYQS